MRAGQLKYTIQILTKTNTIDDFGSSNESWNVYANVRAGIVYKSGDKAVQDYEIFNSLTIDFTIRYDRFINEQMRVNFNDRIYKINFLNKSPFDNSLIISCELISGINDSQPVIGMTGLTMGSIIYEYGTSGTSGTSGTGFNPSGVTCGIIPNYTQFDNTGHQRMFGDARPWRDEVSDALSLKQQGSGVETNVEESSVDFTTNSNLYDYIYCNVQMNHDKDLSCAIYPHIHWFQYQNNVPNFLLQYRWQQNGGNKRIPWEYLRCDEPAFTYAVGTGMNQICYSAPILAPENSTVSDILQFRIFRDNVNDTRIFEGTDKYAYYASVISFDVHFQINSLGSNEQYDK